MTTFFIDLWHDLREKRLWPVAVGLLAAIVAVPAILFKPASDAAPPVNVTPNTGAATAAGRVGSSQPRPWARSSRRSTRRTPSSR